MAKTTGWAPCGERLVDHAPFGHWQTQTPDHPCFRRGRLRGRLFLAALRHDRLDAPPAIVLEPMALNVSLIDGPINRDLFDLYVETRLAPTLQPGDVIILDNLSSHKSPKAAQLLKDIGAWFLPLPPYSPDPGSPLLSQGQAPGQALNPIEMAFAKLKALLRKAAARTCDDLWKAVGAACDLVTEDEIFNYFKAAGHEPE